MRNKRRNQWWNGIIMAICITITVVLCAISIYSERTVESLSDNLIRLHIVANSNANIDQAIKLEVRDAILDYLNDKLDLNNTTEESVVILKNCLPELQQIAATILEKHGLVGIAQAEYGKYPFPTKEYDAVTLPAGTYNALRITLGEGAGANWWCVVFPPLCFADAQNGALSQEADDKLKETLSEEEYALITTTEEGALPVRFKFKVVELVGEAKRTIANWWDSIFS